MPSERGMGQGMRPRITSAVGALGLWAAANGAMAQSISLSHDPAAIPLVRAAFEGVPQGLAPQDDLIGRLLDRDQFGLGVRWDNSHFRLTHDDGAVDSLRISIGGALRIPGGLPIHFDRAEFQAQAYEIALNRDWPEAVAFATERYDLTFTPHAGLGMSSAGGSAEAGATVTLGQKASESVQSRLKAMGVRDGAVFGDEGRWYVFAAASGRAVGLNMQRNNGDWNGAGWSTDPSSALIGNAQVGVGWRKGAMQTSLGYIHREVKGQHMVWGQDTQDDSMVAFSLSIKPRH